MRLFFCLILCVCCMCSAFAGEEKKQNAADVFFDAVYWNIRWLQCREQLLSSLNVPPAECEKRIAAAKLKILEQIKNLKQYGVPQTVNELFEYYFDGVNPEAPALREFDRLGGELSEKEIPEQLFPVRFPMTQKERDARTEYLASITRPLLEIDCMQAAEPRLKIYFPRSKWAEAKLEFFNLEPLSFSYRLMKIDFLRGCEALERGDIKTALMLFERTRKIQKRSCFASLGLLFERGILKIRLDMLSEILSRAELDRDELMRLDRYLAEEENLLFADWQWAWNMETAFYLLSAIQTIDPAGNECGDMDIVTQYITEKADALLSEKEKKKFQIDAKPAQPAVRMILAEECVQAMENWNRFFTWRQNAPRDVRTFFPEWGKHKDVPSWYYLCLYVTNGLYDGSEIKERGLWNIVTRLRAARVMLRHLAGEKTDTLIDPYTGKPFPIRKSEIPRQLFDCQSIKLQGPTARGICVWSVDQDDDANKNEAVKYDCHFFIRDASPAPAVR